MPTPYDLVTTAQVDAWLGVTTDDATIGPLISQISRTVLNFLNRPSLLPRSVTETWNGGGHCEHMLANWPVTAISSLSIDGNAIAAATPLVAGQPYASGYLLEADPGLPPGRPQLLMLRGKTFCRGIQNCVVAYKAGYQISGEAAAVPSVTPFQVTAAQPYGAWASDQGVSYASGQALVAVAANPAQGQYSVAAGIYTFNGADAGQSVLLNYGYVPLDIANAAIEWVADRYRYKDRIGHQSKTLGGQETVAFIVKAIPDFVAAALQPYRHVVPL